VTISWTASDTTVYTVYENPANGTVLEQTYKRRPTWTSHRATT